MRNQSAAKVMLHGDDEEVGAILTEVCALTNMGFAAVARVTETQWIACHVLDKIEFGLDPGDELNIKQTICDEVRDCGEAIVIDEVGADPNWRRHPVPILYGFESYVSFPIYLADGSFYGTLCAIDPKPRALSGKDTIAVLEACAARVADILSKRLVA